MSKARSQWHAWSRDGALLKRTAISIVTGGFLAAWLLVMLTPDPGPSFSADPQEQQLRQQWQRLNRAKEPHPHDAARWLYEAAGSVRQLSLALGIKVTTWEDYARDGLLAGFETRSLLDRHSPEPAVRQLWDTFVRASLEREEAAFQTLAELASAEPPPPTANYLLALHLHERSPQASLAAYLREARSHPDPEVKKEAMALALELPDEPALRWMAGQEDWWSAMPPHLRRQAALELGDARLLLQAMVGYRFLFSAPWGTLSLALLAAAVWYIVLILHGVSGRWRWVAPLLPLAAGVLSVVPVFFLLGWQQSALGIRQDGSLWGELWYQTGGVALREEFSKLLLASLFLPWLLYRRAPGTALLTGAFVGLGFALEENIDYYLRGGEGLAVTRLLTANFFHAALTGLTTHALYQLLRSRFASADRFLLTFFGMVVAHGGYNFGFSPSMGELAGYVPIIILALVSWQFLDAVDQECVRERHWITPAAVFMVGTAVLLAVVFLSVAIRTPDRQMLVATAMQCVSMFPVVFIYWKRLGV